MNGSSGFRGVPLAGSAASGSSGSNPNATNDMNSALRPHHPYFPRLETLTSPLYGTGELTPAGMAAAAAASRLFPAAHLSALHAAAVAAASTVPQTTATHHGMPPPLSQFHHAAAAAAAAAAANPHSVTTAHHPLLSPFLYPHLSSAATYGGQAGSAPTTAPPSFIGGHPRQPPYGSSIESAFVPASNMLPPRYRFLLPTADSPGTPNAPVVPPAPSTSARLPLDRASTELENPPTSASTVIARRLSSPAKANHAAIGASTSTTSPDSSRSSGRIPSDVDQHPRNLAGASAANSVEKTGGDPKKRAKVVGGLPTQPYYPSHFMKGTVIQLANGDLKRVEELDTEDFVRSAHLTSELKIDTSRVVKIEEKSGDIVMLTFSVGGNNVQVSVEATVEHPFFVIGRGWSSFNPERSNNLYGLPCQRLHVGDVCISLTHRDVAARSPIPDIPLSGKTTSAGSGSGSSSSSCGANRHQPPARTTTAVTPTAKSSGHSTDTKTGATVDRRRCDKDDGNARKRRKMAAPLQLGDMSSNFTQQQHRRPATTPPGVSVQKKKDSKLRRRSVS